MWKEREEEEEHVEKEGEGIARIDTAPNGRVD